ARLPTHYRPGQNGQHFAERGYGFTCPKAEQCSHLLAHVGAPHVLSVGSHWTSADFERAAGTSGPKILAGDVVHERVPQLRPGWALPVHVDHRQGATSSRTVAKCGFERCARVLVLEVKQRVAQDTLVRAHETLCGLAD